MTKDKDEKDPFEPSDDVNPLLDTESKGNALGVSQEMFEAILSNRLEMVPPESDSSTLSEKQDDLKLSRKDGAESEEELWLRFFVDQHLEMDPPSPDPPKRTGATPLTPEYIHSGEIEQEGDNSNDIPGFQPLRTDGVNSPLIQVNEENKEDQIDQSALDDNKYIEERLQSLRSDPKGNGRDSAAQLDLVFGVETQTDSSIENETSSTRGGMSEMLSKPEIQPNRKWGSIIALTISLILVAITVGGWKLSSLGFGFSSRLDAGVASIQSELTDVLFLGEDHVLSPEDRFDSSGLIGIADAQGVTQPQPTYDRSMLTQIQKDRLYKASLAYLADGEEEAVYKAQSIGYLPNGGHPATMCGPLAVGILRDALLVDRYVDLEAFWLLNPRDEYTVSAILEKYFPREHYHWYQTSTPVNYFDFKSYPLYTGDFIYLFAGSGGNFEHMLLVTRVDEAGRAYSVSPLETADGYSITEVMLYDPNHPGEGYFYEITNKANAEFGLTGFGGFWMWRRITPIPEYNLNDLAFGHELDAIFDQVGGDWFVYIKEIGDRVVYSRRADEVIHPASIIKVPLVIQFFVALDYQDDDIREYLSERGMDGRTYLQFLEAMLVESDENATQIIENWVDDQIKAKDVFARWGVLDTSFSPRRSTAKEMSWIFEGLYQGEWITPKQGDIILELLSEFSPSDKARLAVIQDNLNGKDRFFNKRGSLVRGRTIVADVAIIEMGDNAFVITLFGQPGFDYKAPTYDDLDAAIGDAALVIWEYLSQQDSLVFHALGSGPD